MPSSKAMESRVTHVFWCGDEGASAALSFGNAVAYVVDGKPHKPRGRFAVYDSKSQYGVDLILSRPVG